MTLQHGFQLIRAQDIPELNTVGRLYRHARTGAELLSLENDDDNKVFGVTFLTLPQDDTGVAHIVEHSVLGGSRRYPVKEPFLELIKGSLATFVNALTYPDRTVYPVASQNLADFYNLMDVYLDAVFHPTLTRHTFEQEGWHYELDSPDAPLTYKGVVFNEMKGVYANPDHILYEEAQRQLFPDTVYARRSGGHPRHIPDLTYDQFVQFHATYYHPTNARFVFYGDDPAEERLRRIDEALREFDARPLDRTVALQAPFASPRAFETAFPASAEVTARALGMVMINWALPEKTPLNRLEFNLLSAILLGTPGSPLRKALTDSGLGEDWVGGLSSGLRQLAFGVGMKGVPRDQHSAVEDLIWRTLTDLADHGLDPGHAEAAFNSFEFDLRENNTGRNPRGLYVMMRALSAWLYDGDPFEALAYAQPLADLRARWRANPRHFEDLIRAHLLNNPHRVHLRLHPSADLTAQAEAEETARLQAIRATLTPEQLQAIADNTATLRALQQAPNTPAALNTLPLLTLGDLERAIKTVPEERHTLGDVPLIYHPLATNGILYYDLGFDLHALPAADLPYLPLFSRALFETGTAHHDLIEFSQLQGRDTGGLWAQLMLSPRHQSADSAAWLWIRGKALAHKADRLLALLAEAVFTARLDNRERLLQMTLEEKTQRENAVAPSGHAYALNRLAAQFSESGWLNELTGGVSQLFFLRDLEHAIRHRWPEVQARLENIRATLFTQANALAHLTLSAADWPALAPRLRDHLAALPAAASPRHAWAYAPTLKNEGLTAPTPVNYVAKSGLLTANGYVPHGAAYVIEKHIRTGWLWNKVRVEGGAYGAFCSINPLTGTLSYASYRDPNLRATLEVYDSTGDFLRATDLSERELTKLIIGTVGELDRPMLADAKGFAALTRALTGITDDYRQQRRLEVLGATARDFHHFAELADQVRRTGRVAVVAAETALTPLREPLNLELTPVV